MVDIVRLRELHKSIGANFTDKGEMDADRAALYIAMRAAFPELLEIAEWAERAREELCRHHNERLDERGHWCAQCHNMLADYDAITKGPATVRESDE